MAVHSVDSPLDFANFAAEPLVDSSRSVSGVSPDGTPEINLGAFRGLAFALIFETVLVILGSLAWQVFRTFTR
jgi:hypothetical protein